MFIHHRVIYKIKQDFILKPDLDLYLLYIVDEATSLLLAYDTILNIIQ